LVAGYWFFWKKGTRGGLTAGSSLNLRALAAQQRESRHATQEQHPGRSVGDSLDEHHEVLIVLVA
jgi:hypothetical protein